MNILFNGSTLLGVAWVLFFSDVSAAVDKNTTDASGEYYDASYCETCHGVGAKGNEGVQAPRIAGFDAWYLQRQLQAFRADHRGAHPSEIDALGMRAIAAKMTDKNIAEVINKISQWQADKAAPTLTGDVVAGKSLYRQCGSCHGPQGEGNEALGAPELAGQNDWYLVNQLRKFKHHLRGRHPEDRYGMQMSAIIDTLPDEEAMINVVSYINTFLQ